MVTHSCRSCRPVKVRRSETDVLPLSYTTKSNIVTNSSKNGIIPYSLIHTEQDITTLCFKKLYLFYSCITFFIREPIFIIFGKKCSQGNW